MTAGDRSFFNKEPGRRPGCPAGKDEQPNSHWVCTDHFTWMGETLHVACSNHRVVGAWFDAERSWKCDQYHTLPDAPDSIAELHALLLTQPGFFVPPTDVEVEEAAAKTAALLAEIESKVKA